MGRKTYLTDFSCQGVCSFGTIAFLTHVFLLLLVSGLSLKSQDLTAIFLGARLFCSIFMETDIHTLLDFATLVSTVWVIYMMRYKLKSTYVEELDNMKIKYLVKCCCL